MYIRQSIKHAAVVAALLLLCGGFSSLLAQRLYLDCTTLLRSLSLPDAGRTVLSHFPGGGFALVRDSPHYRRSRLLEVYNDSLELRWKLLISFEEREEGIVWVGHHAGSVMMVVRRWRAEDTLTIDAYSYDPMTGAPRDTAHLGVFLQSSANKDLRVIPTRIARSPDSSRVVAYTIELPPERENVDGFDHVRVRLALIDSALQRRDPIIAMFPVLHLEKAREVEFRLHGPPVVDSLGRFYIALATGPKTVRIHRIDIEKRTTASVDLPTAIVHPFDDPPSLYDLVMAFDSQGRLMIATSEHDGVRVSAITLHRRDFDSASIDFSSRIEVAESIMTHPDAEEMTDRLRIRAILPAGADGSLVMIEEVLTFGVPSYVKTATGALLGSIQTTQHDIANHRNIVVAAFTGNGAKRWVSVQTRPQSGRQYFSNTPNLWRIEGDTLHYLMNNTQLGRMSLTDGSLVSPRVLLETDLTVDYQLSRWLDPRTVLLKLYDDDYTGVVMIRY